MGRSDDVKEQAGKADRPVQADEILHCKYAPCSPHSPAIPDLPERTCGGALVGGDIASVEDAGHT
jgi:hypothetical protein